MNLSGVGSKAYPLIDWGGGGSRVWWKSEPGSQCHGFQDLANPHRIDFCYEGTLVQHAQNNNLAENFSRE